MKILIKNYIIVLICFFVVAGTSISYVNGSEGKQAEESAKSESIEPEKKYELIEKTKDYLEGSANLSHRGEIELKNKGKWSTFFLEELK